MKSVIKEMAGLAVNGNYGKYEKHTKCKFGYKLSCPLCDPEQYKRCWGYNPKTLEDIIIEAFAELEHDQWMHYVKLNIERGLVTEEAKKRWLPKLVPYSMLSEEEKEKDRVWARKALELLKLHGVDLTTYRVM